MGHNEQKSYQKRYLLWFVPDTWGGEEGGERAWLGQEILNWSVTHPKHYHKGIVRDGKKGERSLNRDSPVRLGALLRAPRSFWALL